ncbi:protein kinase domain containing protein [Acanthamoeba castellanii str. Neff]|uniref:non-specific serine/threonine protein kinase n=1 Tax=Acanthamoeba castellanii (strain ATCC 30010 / Neff) TaxID=1257118 RepID=L8H053_ACACF|nr:protein kinase domain containing protein [Acanthamoeba castellanii str. Neff]ELR18909.1 protein kinase domain containing protein [Acanthamoeba castellanii str. Neff]
MEPGGKIPGYVVTGKLGSGSDSEVYECVKKEDPMARKVAVKVIRKDQAPERLERSRKEAEMHEYFETEDSLYIALECAGGGDLFEVLYSHELNPSQTVLEEKIFTQTALAVSHMHKRGVCHRDLKPENIFLDSEWNVKVGDFGLSLRYLPDRKANDPVGSLIYASPEVLRRESYVGPELDVWALGILLYEMLCGTPPFVGETERDLCKAILAGEYSVPDFVSPGARSLISKMIKLKHYRITLDEVLSHPWVVEGMPTAVTVQRRSRKRRGSIMAASSEDSGSPHSRQAPKEGRKKRKEGSARKARNEEENRERANPKQEQAGVESEGRGASTTTADTSEVKVEVEVVPLGLVPSTPKDFMMISSSDLAAAQPRVLNDDEELATGGTESPVVSDLVPLVVPAESPTAGVTLAGKSTLLKQRDDDIAGTLSGDLEKLKLSLEFPTYSKLASVREHASVPVPPLRSFSSPVVQF